MRGVHSQVNRQVADALVGACHAVRLVLYLLHDGEKVHEFLSLCMQELPILHRPIDQLQNERPPCHNTRATREKISEIIENL